MKYDYINIHELPLYPDLYVHPKTIAHIERDGLIEPLLWDGTEIHPVSRELWMAYYKVFKKMKMATVMLADINKMSKGDLRNLGF